jgi:hypothetical protein
MEGSEWEAVLDGTVNRRNLSTVKTGKFTSKKLGAALNPGGLNAHSHEAASPTGEVGSRKYL